jgi:hypothetical protein
MNKLKQLQKKLAVEAVIVLAILAGVGGLMMLTGNMADAAATKKTTADSGLSQDNAQLASVRTQLNRSGEAEKRFVEIQLNRGNLDFTSKTEALRAWMQEATGRYRFPTSTFKINLPPEVPSTKPELSGLEYAISVRENAGLTLDAISDLHVLSFIADMQRTAPGLVRLNSIDLERKDDMKPQVIGQMMTGAAPSLVSAKISFNWIGINPKETKSVTPDGAAAGAPVP